MGRSWQLQIEFNKKFETYKKKFCKTCEGRLACMVSEEDNGILKYQNKKIFCKNFKPRYEKTYLNI